MVWNAACYMVYQMVALPVTLSDLWISFQPLVTSPGPVSHNTPPLCQSLNFAVLKLFSAFARCSITWNAGFHFQHFTIIFTDVGKILADCHCRPSCSLNNLVQFSTDIECHTVLSQLSFLFVNGMLQILWRDDAYIVMMIAWNTCCSSYSFMYF